MSKTKTTARADGEGIDLEQLPDARVTIDLEQVEDGWIAYDPDDGEGLVGRGETAPRAAEDYCGKVAQLIESNGGQTHEN